MCEIRTAAAAELLDACLRIEILKVTIDAGGYEKCHIDTFLSVLFVCGCGYLRQVVRRAVRDIALKKSALIAFFY